MASINGAYGDITINNNITGASDLEGVLNQGNTMAVGQFIDATAVGAGTAIDATGSDIIAQNLEVEKIIPLGSPIITDVSIDGGLKILTGGNYHIDFEDGIQIKDNNNAFIYSDGTNLFLSPSGYVSATCVDTYVNTLHYTTLDPPISGGGGITYQTTYANLGTDILQTQINTLAGATRKQLIISPGAWTPTGAITFNNLDTCLISGAGADTSITRITPSSGGFTITGASSTRNHFRDLEFNALFTINATQGRHTWTNCNFLGGLLITGTTTNFLVFDNCDFTGGAITIPITFGAVAYFKNCNFAGTTAFNFNNPMATQLIMFGCLGLNPVNPAKITELAFNEINGLTQADASIVNCSTLNSTANVNGVNGTFTDGTTTILLDPGTTKGIEIQNAIGQAKIKLVDTDGDEIEIQNTEIDVYHSASLNQTDRYYQLKDASGNQVDWYMGSTVPSHVATNGSLFVLAGASPSIYQYGSSGWATVGGGSSVVGSYNVPCIVKSTFPTNQSITTTPSVLLFNTNTIETPSSWIGTPSSGVWTIPFNGTYTITALIQITTSVNDNCRVVVYVNGSAGGARDIEYTPTGSNTIALSYTDTFNYGDLIDLRGSNTTGTATYLASGSYATIQAYRQDPLTISSTIYIPKICKYEAGSTQALSSTPNQLLLYSNPDIKTPNNSWITDTTGEFTIVENGVYRIFVSLYFATLASDRTIGVLIYKNGSTIAEDKEFSPSGQSNPIVTCEATESLIAGDIIQPWGYASVASTASTNVSCYWLIEKITV